MQHWLKGIANVHRLLPPLFLPASTEAFMDRKLVGADVGASPFDLIHSPSRILRSWLPFRFRYRNDAPFLCVDARLPE